MNGTAPVFKGLAVWLKIGNRAYDEAPWNGLWAEERHLYQSWHSEPTLLREELDGRFHTDMYFSAPNPSGLKFSFGKETLEVTCFKENAYFKPLSCRASK